MPNSPEHQPPVVPTSARNGVLLGLGVVLGALVAFLAWGMLAELNSGAVATGEVVPSGNAKTVQHLEGGIIKAIRVRDGDLVKVGQELIIMDPTDARATLTINETEQTSLRALVSRLEAERDGRPLPPVTAAERLIPSIQSQMKLFDVRRESLLKNISVLDQRIEQTRQEIIGLKSEYTAYKTMLGQAAENSKMNEDLYKQNYIAKPAVLQGQSKVAELEGQVGRSVADTARAQQRIVETEMQIAGLKSDWMNKVLEDLRKGQDDFAAADEKVRVARARLDRSVVRAPIEGLVKGLKFMTLGGVVAPGGAMMDIVPTEDRLVVDARVQPDDIRSVRVGLPSHVRFTAYKNRVYGTFLGKVTQVSADTFRDEKTGASYYKARIEVGESELKGVDPLSLHPGMLAQVEIVAGERTALRYLTDPIRYSVARAFKEQ